MYKTLKLTQKQNELLHILQLDGLKKQIELQEATDEYNKAKEIEKHVKQHVIDNNFYTNSINNDPEYGNRITSESESFMMDETILKNDFLPKVKEAYMSLYGIDNPLNFVYSYPMHERKLKAEKAYRMIAVDFLRISGNQAEAEKLEKSINGYLRPSLLNSLNELIDNFINGK